MLGPTLSDIRDYIEDLASEDGEYYVVCARTGDRPVPAAGNWFQERATARAAARATEQYRSALRRYDPQVPYYDLIVCEEADTDTTTAKSQKTVPDTPQRTLSDPVLDSDGAPPVRHDLVEFCHRVAGAVFETLSGEGYDAVESAVMDGYFELAETVDDPDELCLCLLESMASELEDRLEPSEQATVLTGAARRLEAPDGESEPLAATLSTLDARGLLESYTHSPWADDFDGGAQSVVVTVSGYSLSPRDGRLPVLPLTLELSRHQPKRLPQSVAVEAISGGWQLTFSLTETADHGGLVCAPVDEG